MVSKSGDVVSPSLSNGQHTEPAKQQNGKHKKQHCRIVLLDGCDYDVFVNRGDKAQVLFDKVVEHLNLLEKDYFGLTFRDHELRIWLQLDKPISKQIWRKIDEPWLFYFEVKFYPPEPLQLQEDLTKYLLCLQLRNDIVSGSFLVQSQFGDYDPVENGTAEKYLADFKFAPQQSTDMLEKVHELHKTHKGQTPGEAEAHYLDNAKKLGMYGIDLHVAKDSDDLPVQLGVCSSGLLVFRDKLRIGRYPWPKILKISYRRIFFYIKIRLGEFEQTENTVGFRLPSYRAAKCLWRSCVEHHTFFRLMAPDVPTKRGLFSRIGSTGFTYFGRTQYQTRLASTLAERPPQRFQRSISGRFTGRSLDGIAHTKLKTPPEERLHSVSFIDEKASRDLSLDKSPSVNSYTNRQLDKADPQDSYRLPDGAANPRPEYYILTHQKSPDDTPRCHELETTFGVETIPISSVSPRSTAEKNIERQLKIDEQLQAKVCVVSSLPTTAGTGEQILHAERDDNLVRFASEHHVDAACGDKVASPVSSPHCGLLKFQQSPNLRLESPPDSARAPEAKSTKEKKDLPKGKERKDKHKAKENSKSPRDLDKSKSGNSDSSDEEQKHGLCSGRKKKTKGKKTSVQQQEPAGKTTGESEHVSGPHVLGDGGTVNKIESREEHYEDGPVQTVVIEGEDGVTTTVTTQVRTVKQIIQRQTLESFQSVETVPTVVTAKTSDTKLKSTSEVPLVQTQTKIVSYDTGKGPTSDYPGDFVSSQTVTSGDKTVETVTYKTEKGGVVETHTERKLIITSTDGRDHDKELTSAILEATRVNPNIVVEMIEVKQQAPVV